MTKTLRPKQGPRIAIRVSERHRAVLKQLPGESVPEKIRRWLDAEADKRGICLPTEKNE